MEKFSQDLNMTPRIVCWCDRVPGMISRNGKHQGGKADTARAVLWVNPVRNAQLPMGPLPKRDQGQKYKIGSQYCTDYRTQK